MSDWYLAASYGSFGWQLELLAKVVGAMALGGIIGFEREMAKRPAGFRTHMFVAGASAMLVRLAEPLLRIFEDESVRQLIEGDPFRAISAVVTGIAFLGAGSIIQKENQQKVKGLTTAASLLFAGTIGIATAVELWALAAMLTIVVLIVLNALNVFERWILRRASRSEEESD